ncbi:NAD-dependent epimerase/dehydratase family protein [Candidatus Woesearchaeota archaeon]|nr:NAD-dependent epimerase/dehydratase family protein [Candidatus Woesearchaeota archaeon]
MTKVLVTGGSGFIGREIVQTLLKKGFEVNVLDIFNVDVPGITFFQGSVLDQEIISKAMSNCEYVIHMAAILGVSKSSYAPVECLDVNVLGTRNVLKCCVIHGIKKIVFPSSSEVYGEPVRVPVTEDTVLQPKSEYGVSKSVCEEYIKAYKKQHNLDFKSL